ncbi:MAG: hypothetical protein KBC73_06885 [Burkholderiaceae bacterium]|nr:hypothetical protein [Burkholderiaceae bacterium]
MEVFSTPRRAPLLWVTDLATVALVVAAVGWSGTQRPGHDPVLAQQASASLKTAPATPLLAAKPALATPLALDTLAVQGTPLLGTDGADTALRSVAFKLPAAR